jgi:uncharacterized membrane protein YkvA (DUF1232 family)
LAIPLPAVFDPRLLAVAPVEVTPTEFYLTEVEYWLTQEAYAVYLACRDPRTPWPIKLLAVGVVACALSPTDLIPDFIPLLGYADDLILVPLGIFLVRRLLHKFDKTAAMRPSRA